MFKLWQFYENRAAIFLCSLDFFEIILYNKKEGKKKGKNCREA
jgi:hypothetical protein